VHSPDAARLFSWPMIMRRAGVMLASLGRWRDGQARTVANPEYFVLFIGAVWLSGDGKTDFFSGAALAWRHILGCSNSFNRTKLTLFSPACSVVLCLSPN